MNPTILIIGAIIAYFFYAKKNNASAENNLIVYTDRGNTIENLLKFKVAPGFPVYGSAAFTWGKDLDGKVWFKNIDINKKTYYQVLNTNNQPTQLYQDSTGLFYFIQDSKKYSIK